MYGRQEPTAHVAPIYAETHGGKADALLRKAGVELMPWQRSLLDDWLALTPSGDWAAPSCGLSVPRQNGKTHVIAARIAWGMVAYAEWCVYTSHLQKTSTETFETLRDIFESGALKKYVKDIKSALGREEIILTNGGRCKFLARTRNGGRGQHGDLWCVDEAQELTDEQQGSFLPLLAASKRPQTIYTGTPPDENAPGEVFGRLRRDALDGKTSRTAWSEWSVDSIGDTSDERRWSDCNPSMGYRIKNDTVRGEHEQMARDRFARERLGWWSAQTASAVIDAAKWDACKTDDPPSDGLLSYAVKFSPDGSRGVLSVCLKPANGKPHIEVIEARSMSHGITWFADWLEARKGKAAQITVDGMANAQPLVDELIRRGVPQKAIVKPRSGDVASACAELLNAVNECGITHFDQAALNESASKSKRRSIGGGGGWGFADNGCDSALIESCALALWGANHTKRNPNRKQRFGF